MKARIIRWEDYDRRAHFEYFCSLPNPWVGVTAEVDVTDFAARCKERGWSFYAMFMHAAALAANAVPQLRQRIRKGQIVEYDACATSHTELAPNGTYCYCTLHHDQCAEEYAAYAQAERSRCRVAASLEEDEDVEGMLFITSLPWIHYLQLIQPTPGPEESNPRISWGKYEKNWKGRLMMPVTLLAHHALVDGLHMAQFYEELKKTLSETGREGTK